MSRYLLRFIGGKYEGGQIELPDSGEVGVGRAQELAICLVEDMVSRHHAKIEVANGQVILSDLQSTNGTFVNGERIKKCELEHDDRVLFGTSMLRLVDTEHQAVPAAQAVAAPPANDGATRVVPATDSMSGELSDVALTDLLQLLGGNQRSGVVELSRAGDSARIVLRQGHIVGVYAPCYAKLSPIKTLSRLVTWGDGQFSFGPRAPAEAPHTATLGRAEEALMEAARLNDEAGRLWESLGGPNARYHLSRPWGGRLASLDAAALDVFQAVYECQGAIRQMLDQDPAEDAGLLQQVLRLRREGFIDVTPVD